MEQARYPDDYFDTVNMHEVIEHLSDPKRTLLEIYRIMKSGGILIIKTSNIESIYARLKEKKWDYLLPGHLCYFSIKTLDKLLTSIGFREVNINKNLTPKEIIQTFGVQSYIMSLLLQLNQKSLANWLIRGMTFFVRKK